MDFNQTVFLHERKRREMEAEMSRFEEEIAGNANFGHERRLSALPSSYEPIPGPRAAMGQQAMQFIPHQLQRQVTPNVRPGVSTGTSTGAQVAAQVAAAASSNVKGTSTASFTISSPATISTMNPPVNYTVTPMGLPPTSSCITTPAMASSSGKRSSRSSGDTQGMSKSKKKRIVRMAGNQIWEDNSLLEWETDDFRLFCGDLGNDVTEDVLTRAFNKFPSFLKAKVVRDKRTNKTKGFGFISFRDPHDFIRAMREMNGKYVGSRPIKLRKSTWKERNIDMVKKKTKEKVKLGLA